MNKTARQVLRLCAATRNLGKFPGHIGSTYYFKIPLRSYSSIPKDDGLPTLTEATDRKNDVIFKSLSSANTIPDILDVVKKYRSMLSHQHSKIAMKKLVHLQYATHKDTDQFIVNNPGFLILCEAVISDIKSLDANDAVDMLRLVTSCKVPSTSVLSQSLLQVIRQSISHLKFRQLVDLHFLLKDLDYSPLTKALRIAVPNMCEIQLSNKMLDMEDDSDLTTALAFLATSSKNMKLLEVVINTLCSKGQDMNSFIARRIFRYLCICEHLTPGYEELLFNVQQVIIKNMHQMSSSTTSDLILKLTIKITEKGHKEFYNEEFVDACAEHIISTDAGLKQGVAMLSKLRRIGHTQIRLIDYVAAKCFENPSILTNSGHNCYMNLIIALAMADYKPIFWEIIHEIILKNIAKNEYPDIRLMLNLATSLAVFDSFNKDLTKRVFNTGFLKHILTKIDVKNTYWNLLLFYQAVKLFSPTYTGPWPSEQIIQTAIELNGLNQSKANLLPALVQAMGGSQYILSNLKTKLGHHIDHVIIMRKGGYPVAVNTSEISEPNITPYIEDLQLPVDSQVIIVINLPDDAYSTNSRRLKGDWALLLKTLETLTGYTVISISSKMWNGLMDREKIPYLMQAIRLKFDSISAFANV
ncbi:uncharacterized protein LOC105687202 [Athalia rosae]|uniref:uncharacterized protein LOC105687202 n=1 Tax=Athalia rosae TaxID=37344 RepID=UPI0020347607|nr:uncharacterized protein LOC105687202 [Athalia rosae]